MESDSTNTLIEELRQLKLRLASVENELSKKANSGKEEQKVDGTASNRAPKETDGAAHTAIQAPGECAFELQHLAATARLTVEKHP
jgi:hypothetical protein